MKGEDQYKPLIEKTALDIAICPLDVGHGRMHTGMQLVTLHLMKELVEGGKTVYINFELPKIARQFIGRYAEIKQIDMEVKH